MIKGNGMSYVRCQVEPGMFREEWLVWIDAVDPKNYSQPAKVQLFVDQREVTEVKGKPKRKAPAPRGSGDRCVFSCNQSETLDTPWKQFKNRHLLSELAHGAFH